LDAVTAIQQVLPDHVDLGHDLMGVSSLRNIFLGIGKFPDGQVKPVSAPLERLVHIAEAGSSGFGKSTHMQALAYQCLNAREAPRVVMLDPQAVTFTPFAGDERLKYPIASQESLIVAILLELVGEMEHRQQLFAQWRGVANLTQYNQAVTEAERLPQIPVFFDEFGLVAGNKEIAKQVKKLSQGDASLVSV
jgi:DNA segregation ATPase FtsK/SpoIIIE-like protein